MFQFRSVIRGKASRFRGSLWSFFFYTRGINFTRNYDRATDGLFFRDRDLPVALSFLHPSLPFLVAILVPATSAEYGNEGGIATDREARGKQTNGGSNSERTWTRVEKTLRLRSKVRNDKGQGITKD